MPICCRTPGYGTPGGSVSAASSPWTLQPTGSAFDDRENLIKASEQSSGSKPAGAVHLCWRAPLLGNLT